MCRWIVLAVAALLVACAPAQTIPSGPERQHVAQQLVQEAGWHWLALDATASRWPLFAAVPRQRAPASLLTVYIEGDGLAWLGSTRASPDPTPVQPVALEVALRDTEPAAWLARPCQYQADAPACEARWWTSHRFAPDVVASMSAGLDALKRHTGARALVLVGYSGGGALAVLLADRRRDVVGLATFAGNLDTDTWTRRLGLSSLSGSLNPADAAARVASIPQVHFVGDQDAVMPREVALAYEAGMQLPTSRIRTVAGADHACCWRRHWTGLVRHLPRRTTVVP